ncbi:MAG TPA: hypothetical protein DIT99_15660 [Candidatus Latescibacteria bacterium]|nr:hypothetical protein [Candidatus Latescibacterota bacterium]
MELGTYRRRGDCVGEMTLLDEQPRSASLRAKTDVQILYIARAQFNFLLSSYPDAARELFKVLSARLRESLNIQISSIRREAAIEQEIKLAGFNKPCCRAMRSRMSIFRLPVTADRHKLLAGIITIT